MFDGESVIAADSPVRVQRTLEEIAEFLEWDRRFSEKCRLLDEIEPIPDNFDEICKGKAWPPVYSKARAA